MSTEKPVEKLMLPEEWQIKINSFGSPKMIKNDIKIDYVPLDDIDHIKRRGLEPTIKNFISGVPLTIHSIVYHLQTQTIEEVVGLKALETKTVGINNYTTIKILRSGLI